MKFAERYEPTGNTESGGMGDIIECNDTHLQRRVIIKRLQAGIEERRLLDEQRALARLRSKHVVQLFDILELTDRRRPDKAIVIEFIDGKNLEVGSFNPGRAYLNTLWQIACGLHDIHEAGLIHRDIKPNNIRMDSEGVIKIIDFGLSRSRDEAKTRGIIGTPIFMAPELWKDSTVSFSQAIDVYAFGATAIALLSTNAPEELASHPPRQIDLPTLGRALPGLQSNITSLIHNCLKLDPADRPTMSEVQSYLARHLLENEHRALVVFGGKPNLLDKTNRKITLKSNTLGSVSIEYNGFDFRVSAVVGSIFLNNTIAHVGSLVPGCCVLTFGTGSNRRFVTFDVSHPEVMP